MDAPPIIPGSWVSSNGSKSTINESSLRSIDLATEPEAVFEDDFPTPKDLFKSMAANCCILSGPRAVNSFLPGAISAWSDYEFYTAGNGHCIFGMIAALEAQKVIWEHPLETFNALLDAEDTTEIQLNCQELEAMVDAFDHWGVQAFQGPRMHRVIEILRSELAAIKVDESPSGTIDIVINNRSNYSMIVHVQMDVERQYDHASDLNIIRGVTKTGIAVKLIYAPRKSAVSHVLRFHSTAVQCFISPFGSAHLYFGMARENKSWLWGYNTAHGRGERKFRVRDIILQKWALRGFAAHDRKDVVTGLRSRRIGDGESLFIPFEPTKGAKESELGLDAPLIKSREQILQNLVWYEQDHQTHLAPDLPGVTTGPRAEGIRCNTFVPNSDDLISKFSITTVALAWTSPHDVHTI